MLSPVDPRTCRTCGKQFLPFNSLQAVCGVRCAQRLATGIRRAKDKQERASTRARREAVKTKKEWLKELERLVNKYVRLRDRDKGCISCDKGPNWHGQWHASHFRSVAAASSIRFHLWNIQKSCSQCNDQLSGNHAAYRPRLIALRGLEAVEWLESQNQIANYTIDYIKRFKAVMSKKIRRLEKRHALQD